MARTGSRLLGARSSAAAPGEGTELPEPAGDGGGTVPPVGGRRRRALNAMSPFRIGFLGTLGVLLAYGLARALVAAQSVVILVVVALFIALGLDPFVRRLTRVGLKRGLAILLVLVGVLVVLALVLYATIPVFIAQVGNLIDAGPGILQETLRNPQVNALNERYQVISKAQEFISSGSLLQGAFGGLLGAAGAVLGAVFSGFTVLILALYFLVSLPQIRNAVVHLSPGSRRARAGYLTDQIFSRISAYISGTFVVALIAGVLSYVFLLIVGLGEFALALAVLVAVLDIIPLIGATLGAIVVVIIGFTQSPTVGIACLVFYALYQQFENYVVQPRVFKCAVDVPGVLVVIAALVGGALLGITGALLAVPVAAVALLILREVAQPQLDAG